MLLRNYYFQTSLRKSRGRVHPSVPGQKTVTETDSVESTREATLSHRCPLYTSLL